MLTNNIALAGYAAFLAVILIVNLLYFFQVFRYRLPGDASIPILVIHIALILTILISSSILLGVG